MSPPQQHARHTTTNTRRAAPTHARPLRPPPLGPRKNSHPGSSKKTPISLKTTSTSAKSPNKRDSHLDADEEDMAGLPQFCATCEKQIFTPAGTAILYCSESCRRKDHNKPLSHSILPPEPSPQPTTPRNSYFFDEPQHEILPLRSPTVVRPPSLAFSDDSSDSSSYNESQPSYRRSESDTSQYLHHQRYFSGDHSPRRASYEPFTPSLSYTPASLIIPGGSYLSARPLPGRKNPYSASFSSLSVDLVTPVVNTESLTGPTSLSHNNASLRSGASTSTAFRVAEGEMSYEKKPYAHSTSPSKGSLKQLFFHEAMQAPPQSARQLSPSSKWDDGEDEQDHGSDS